MLTIFTTPRPFHDHFNIIQRNAIKSWTLLRPECEVILFGDEEGTAEVAAEFGVWHIPKIERNEFGTPLLSSAFNLAQKLATKNFIASLSGDVILMSDFTKAVGQINKEKFLMVGRRWDLDLKEEINFNNPNWESELCSRINKEGKLHGFSAIDYFVFPCDFKIDFPPFAMGAPGWDDWFIYNTKRLKVPVIDATEVVNIVHPNHDRPRKKSVFFKIEKQRNFELAGGLMKMCTLRDSDWILTKNGLRRPKFPRIIFSALSLFYPWRLLLSFKRKLQQFFRWCY